MTVPVERAGDVVPVIPASAPPPLDPAALVPWLVRVSGADGSDVESLPIRDVAVDPTGAITMTGRGQHFSADARWTPLPGRPTGWTVTVEVGLDPEARRPVDAALAIAVRVPASGEPRWLIPGVFIGENRPAESRARYPRWVADPAKAAGDPFAAGDWWLRSDRAATPVVIASGSGLRVALATSEMSAAGLTGIGFGTVDGDDGPQRELRCSFPYRELPVVYDGSAEPLPPDRPVHRWLPGARLAFHLRVYAVADGDEATTEILRSLHDWLAPDEPTRPPVPAEETASLAADALLNWHYRPHDSVLIETAAFERRGDGSELEPGDRLAMHVAWLSGAPAAAALLRHGLRTGREGAVSAGRAVLDAIATHLAPCGTFWGQWTADAGWGKGWTPGPDAVHARTLAEAALFMTRAAALDPEAGDAWRAAVASNGAFVVGVQGPDGAIPSAWNAATGEPLSWTGTAGLAWAPALVEAAELLEDRRPLEAARRLGERHARDVESGTLAGAPEDVDLGPTSEDGYVAVMAYVALARSADTAIDRARWIDLARRSADWMLAFRYTYDVTFPPDSLLARSGFRSRGADLASPANQHLHSYGLVCSSELVELARMTGDSHYADRARETFACFRQAIARHDGDLGGRRGMAPERFYQTRYDGAKGEIGPISHAWCLGLLLHASELALETPELTADG